MHDPIQVDKQGYSDLYDHTLTDEIAVILASLTFNINGDTSKLEWDDFHGPLFREKAVWLIHNLSRKYSIEPKSDLRLYLCKYTYLGYEPPEPVICLAVASSETDALVKVTQKDVFVKGYHGEWDVNVIEIPGYTIEVKPK